MQPASIVNSTHSSTYLGQEHRTRLFHLLNDLTDAQLRFVLNKYLQQSSLPHQFQHYSRLQLFQQCLNLIDVSYTNELEQSLYALKQTTSDLINQRNLLHNNNVNSGNYRLATQPPLVTGQFRSIRPNSNFNRPANIENVRGHIQQQTQLNSSQIRSINPLNQHFQTSIYPSSIRNQIVHKSLPFYHILACVYERFHVFQYDQYRKQHISHNELLLSIDVCNQLALSYDIDLRNNSYKTSKSLILRLIRIDQSPTINGKYDDNLPPNLVIYINRHLVTNLPIPKACTRQHNDLVRAGKEIDITSNCMFNPMIKNEVKMAWSYHLDNTNLHHQYSLAQFAAHIFLVEHLTCNDLCCFIRQKTSRFTRNNWMEYLNKIHAYDRDLGLEVSDQKLKLTCPIDQRRLKIPVRSTTCQHLQCFDLMNYLTLNEKSNKWICPVCNKYALFDDIQIDTYMQSILNSIEDKTLREIIINSELSFQPVLQSNNADDEYCRTVTNSSSTELILIDDDN